MKSIVSALLLFASCSAQELLTNPKDFAIHLILDELSPMKLSQSLGGNNYYGEIAINARLFEDRVELVYIDRISLRDTVTDQLVINYFYNDEDIEPRFVNVFREGIKLHLKGVKPKRIKGAPERSEYVLQIVSLRVNR